MSDNKFSEFSTDHIPVPPVYFVSESRRLEIERLKADKDFLTGQLLQSRSYVSTYSDEIERLRAHIESTRTMTIFQDHQAERASDKKLITELADALKIVTRSLREAVTNEDIAPCAIQNLNDLDKRAREATKDE